MTKPHKYIECPRVHSTQDYNNNNNNKPSLNDLILESLCKKKAQNLDLALSYLS